MSSLSTPTRLPPIAPDDEQALHAYVDQELSGAERRALEARLAEEPALRLHLDEIRQVGRWFTAEAEREARAIPQARFEQLWDELEATLAKDAAHSSARSTRAAAAAARDTTGGWAGWWERLRWPAGVAALAAAAVVVFTVASPSVPSAPEGGAQGGIADRGGKGPSDPAARPEQAPRDAGADVAAPAPVPPSAVGPDLRIADASDTARDAAVAPGAELPSPDSNDADIERIEFGGASGQISRIEGVRGTTTVIWVEEDDQPADTERSL